MHLTGAKPVCYTAGFSVVTQRSFPQVGRSVAWRHQKPLCSRLGPNQLTIYKNAKVVEIGNTEKNSSLLSGRDLNWRPPDCKFNALTTRPRCNLQGFLICNVTIQCLSYMSRFKVLHFPPMFCCVDCYIFAAYQDVLGHFLGKDSFLILTVPTLLLFSFYFHSLWTKPSNFSVSMSGQVTIRWGLLSRMQFPFSLTLNVVSRQSCYCTFLIFKRSSSLCTSAPSPPLP